MDKNNLEPSSNNKLSVKRCSYSGLSKRTKSRELSEEKREILRQLMEATCTNNSNSLSRENDEPRVASNPSLIVNHSDDIDADSSAICFSSSSSDSNSDSHSESGSNDLNLDENIECLSNKLQQWHNNHNIQLSATTELLHILHPYHPTLPLDSRTLLKTPRIIKSVPCAGGSFIYFGLKENLVKRISLGLISCSYPIIKDIAHNLHCPFDKIITITVNVDGLPLNKSTTKCFWPLLCVLDQSVNRTPFIVALYFGNSKPNNSTEFFQDFVNECLLLEKAGIIVNNVNYMFRISCIVADSPARSFLKNIVSHNSLHACEKCTQEGIYMGRTTWQYQNKKAVLRNNESFKNFLYDDHQYSVSILSSLSLGLITQVPLDYMHLLCLGVMKRLIRVWVDKGPKKCKLNFHRIEIISERLLTIGCSYYPKEFSRRPRPLNMFKYWKSTEFRSFLLYLGPVVLINVLPDPLYTHFLILHCAMYILCSEFCQQMVWMNYAKELLDCFVRDVASLYCEELLVYNFHNLLHLVDDAVNYGCLDYFSAFPFENFMGKLKKMVHGQNKPLQQIANRLIEKMNCNEPVHEKRVVKLKDGRIKYIILENDITCKPAIDTLTSDSCFVTKNNEIVVVRLIESTNNCSSYNLYCDIFNNKCDFYTLPLKSSLLGIFKVDSLKSGFVISCTNILKKCLLLPCFNDKSQYVCVPYCNMELTH